MDRLTSMAVFIRAAETGSFAAAAQALNMSPQMVAKHVAYLEARLGATLLNRTTRRQSLSELGRAYYERCRVVLAEAEAADSVAMEMKAEPKGILRVNAPVTFGSVSLAPFVTRYLARYPEMQIDLTLNDGIVDPLEEGYEVIIRIGGFSEGFLAGQPLRPYRLIVCAAPSYVAERGMPQTLADLARHDCLVHGIGTTALSCRWMFERAGRTEDVGVKGRLRSNDWKALLHAAIEGYGVTLGPEDVLKPEIAAGRLVRVLEAYEGMSRPMHVLYPAARRPTVKVRSFVDALMAAYGPESAGNP
ncbi:LysR family transcriptional regulator [Martelella alba]|uniref:LysR family transcriptional regulator n=1 Tax=Martelella alba TaxID=2590451 RepID=A0A506UA63_9HYPH|nr:LysR family transcriptional regulator [Martelella alba]TPW29479.1 LysR family transcriptional regulator [Martelella alba]